jgi:hypothetical protein
VAEARELLGSQKIKWPPAAAAATA